MKRQRVQIIYSDDDAIYLYEYIIYVSNLGSVCTGIRHLMTQICVRVCVFA